MVGYEVLLWLMILVLLKLDISQYFLKLTSMNIVSLKGITTLRDSKSSSDDIRLIKWSLFLDGLSLWNEHYESIEQWEIVEPSNIAFEIVTNLDSDSVEEIIEKFENNSWVFLVYPMIPDVLVHKLTHKPMSAEETDMIVDFFLKQRLYRQLACLISLHEPKITCDHFRTQSVDNLIGVLEHLFKMKLEKVEEFIGELGNDKMFMMAPLVACKEQDPVVVRKVIATMANNPSVSKKQLVAQVCIGFMLTDYTSGTEIRNEHLACKFVPSLFKNHSKDDLPTIIKACRIMHLIKARSSSEQRILKEIYMD